MTLKVDGWPRKIIGHLFYTTSSFVHHFKSIGEFNWSYSPEMLNLSQNRQFFVPCDLEIWWRTSKNNRAHFFFTKVTVRKRLILVKISDISSRMTLKFDVWPWKTKGQLFYDTSSFVHPFIVFGEFKLELQSGNAQFGSKSTIFLAVWPCVCVWLGAAGLHLTTADQGRVGVWYTTDLNYSRLFIIHAWNDKFEWW